MTPAEYAESVGGPLSRERLPDSVVRVAFTMEEEQQARTIAAWVEGPRDFEERAILHLINLRVISHHGLVGALTERQHAIFALLYQRWERIQFPERGYRARARG